MTSATASSSTSASDWLDDILPLLRCPDTHQSLRRATAEECAAHQMSDALATLDGTRLFLIDDGIPLLLPQA